MISHGFVSSGLFLAVGVLYDRYHTRLLKYLGGFNYYMPLLSLIFLILTLGNISFPGTVSFIGEVLIIFGFFTKNIVLTIITVIGCILSAIYALWLYNRIFSGQIIQYKLNLINKNIIFFFNTLMFQRYWSVYFIDINFREFMIFSPLIVSIIYFGVNPFFVIDSYLFNIIQNFELCYDLF